MSHSDLLVIVQGKPDNVVFWSNVEGGNKPPCTLLEMIIQGPMVRGSLTYKGEQRTVYINKNWDDHTLLRFNGNATLI
jgi:hypothetical protein